jgi:hypothetical protein
MCANFKLRHERYGCFKWSVVCNDFSVSDRRPGGRCRRKAIRLVARPNDVP